MQNYYNLQPQQNPSPSRTPLEMDFTREDKRIPGGPATYKFHQFQFDRTTKPQQQQHCLSFPPSPRIIQVPRVSAPVFRPSAQHRKSRSVDHHPIVVTVGVGSFICFYCGETSTTAHNGRHKCARKVIERHFYKEERREEVEAAESLVSLSSNNFINSLSNSHCHNNNALTYNNELVRPRA